MASSRTRPRHAAFTARGRGCGRCPAEVGALLKLCADTTPLEALRSAVSVLGGCPGWGPTLDLDAHELRSQALRLGAVVPTIVAAAYRTARVAHPSRLVLTWDTSPTCCG